MYGKQHTSPAKQPKLSESPPKNYLKKDDISNLEDIKKKLGQSDEMMQIRNKYKGKNPSVQFLAKVPMYQRNGYLKSKSTVEFLKDLEEKRKELKDRAKPLDYDELKEHERRVDVQKTERKLNVSAFTNRDTVNLEDSLAAVEEGTMKKIKRDHRNEFLRRREIAKTITGLDKKVPTHLVHYKLEINSWAREHQRAKDLNALRKEKGNQYGKELKEKVLAKRKGSAQSAKDKIHVTFKIENVSDLNKLNKSSGPNPPKSPRAGSLGNSSTPYVDREFVNEVGNQYFSDTNKKYNSQNALKHILGDKSLKKRENVGNALKFSSLFGQRAEKAERLANLYQSSPQNLKFVNNSADFAADQWTKAIETKINALDFLESQMKSKGPVTSPKKVDPVKLPPVTPSDPKVSKGKAIA